MVAEGVEDAAAYAMLAKLGCDFAQGYFIAQPMPQAEFVDWLARYNGLSEKGARLLEEPVSS